MYRAFRLYNERLRALATREDYDEPYQSAYGVYVPYIETPVSDYNPNIDWYCRRCDSPPTLKYHHGEPSTSHYYHPNQEYTTYLTGNTFIDRDTSQYRLRSLLTPEGLAFQDEYYPEIVGTEIDGASSWYQRNRERVSNLYISRNLDQYDTESTADSTVTTEPDSIRTFGTIRLVSRRGCARGIRPTPPVLPSVLYLPSLNLSSSSDSAVSETTTEDNVSALVPESAVSNVQVLEARDEVEESAVRDRTLFDESDNESADYNDRVSAELSNLTGVFAEFPIGRRISRSVQYWRVARRGNRWVDPYLGLSGSSGGSSSDHSSTSEYSVSAAGSVSKQSTSENSESVADSDSVQSSNGSTRIRNIEPQEEEGPDSEVEAENDSSSEESETDPDEEFLESESEEEYSTSTEEEQASTGTAGTSEASTSSYDDYSTGSTPVPFAATYEPDYQPAYEPYESGSDDSFYDPPSILTQEGQESPVSWRAAQRTAFLNCLPLPTWASTGVPESQVQPTYGPPPRNFYDTSDEDSSAATEPERKRQRTE